MPESRLATVVSHGTPPRPQFVRDASVPHELFSAPDTTAPHTTPAIDSSAGQGAAGESIVSRYTVRKRGCSVDLGWDSRGFGTFYAHVRGGDPKEHLEVIGRPPRRTRSVDEFEAWLGPLGPLTHALRLRLMRDQAGEPPSRPQDDEEATLLDALGAPTTAAAPTLFADLGGEAAEVNSTTRTIDGEATARNPERDTRPNAGDADAHRNAQVAAREVRR